MNQKELTEGINSGRRLIVVEYRSGKAEEIKWSDKETGKSLQGIFVRHIVEAGDTSVGVSEKVADGFKIADFKPSFPKGTKCVLEFTEYKTIKGATSARGTMVVLT